MNKVLTLLTSSLLLPSFFPSWPSKDSDKCRRSRSEEGPLRALGFSEKAAPAPLMSWKAPSAENGVKALHAWAVRCILPVGREAKTGIPV